ncbi:WG repeat-containing protein [Mucilaginibacter lacusdianchii]|uniref:WG repeat-containing protein n=1 Tax=Mucilaginibacter lacusdianchii TaxID=2684211 RepID=UPI00131B82AE|nr:WG repeat-containing protein [Mucilaginibacter sp. JXJ CY 39]
MRIIKACIILLSAFFYAKPLAAQTAERWYRFYDAKDDLYGYKNPKGRIKINPRFNGLTRAKIFKNIIAVTEYNNGKSYYLLKNGKKVGSDSLYVSDMSYDCEQEGKIRFRDAKTDKVGFFGADGKILIPTIYNDARPFYNGLAVVLYNGKRLCADGSEVNSKNPCEHWYWNGTTALINSKGRLIADSLDIMALQNINWYSMQISDHAADTTLRVSFKGKNGRYYSFIDYEKQFKQWFYKHYLNQHNVTPSTFDLVCVEGLFKNRLRKFLSKQTFGETYHGALLKKLQRIKTGKIEIQILSEPLNDMIFTQPQFKTFYTDCGDANIQKYPLFDVVTTTNNSQGKFLYQEHFSFLRTTGGYKLIEVAWKTLQ